MTFEFFSDVKEDKLQANIRKLIADCLTTFNGKRVSIVIKRIKSKRSLNQNNYIHVLFTIFAKELTALTGEVYSMETVKNMCKLKFAQIDVVDKNTGEIIGKDLEATSKMSKSRCAEFTEQIIRWAAEQFQIVLPYPNEQVELKIGPE